MNSFRFSDRSSAHRSVLTLAGLCLAAWIASPGFKPAKAHSSPAGVQAKMRALSVRTPLLFIENRGQAGPEGLYYAHAGGVTAAFSRRGVTYWFSKAAPREAGPRLNGVPLVRPGAKPRHSLALEFLNAEATAGPAGRLPQPTRVSSFTGPRPNWRTDLRTYGELVYRDLWPGIDLVYAGSSGRLKYQFEVQPGADPNRIRLAYRGARGMRIARGGALEVTTAAGVFRDEAPIAWQERNGTREAIFSTYRLTGPADYMFDIGSYDRSRTLIVDPAVFAYGTFIGGAGGDRGLGLAVDAAGAVFVTGHMVNPANNTLDAYVGKVNPAGTAFDYFTMIGGAGEDEGFDIVIDSFGNAYVTGYTDSSQATFPLVMGPDLTYNGGGDAFVVKVNSTGNALLYSGYLGGSGIDFGEGIAVDPAGNAYVTGVTNSNQSTFPTVAGPDLTFNGSFDCFVSKVIAVPNGPTPVSNLAYSGYIGGSQDDVGLIRGFLTAGHIALDLAGNAYISGMTNSPETTFPTGTGFGNIPGFDRTHNGGYDAWVAKVRADGAGLVYATYIGGRLQDLGFGMAVDLSGNAYFTGDTRSGHHTFPVTVGPDLTYNGGRDAFVGKLDPNGTALVFLGYLGGSDVEQGLGLEIDLAGNVYVVGYTESADFPVVGGPDLTFNGSGFAVGDAYVVKVKANPNSAVVTDNFGFASFIGGVKNEWAFWVGVDPAGNVYVIGDTQSTETTFPDGDGFGAVPGLDQTFAGGGADAFLVKIGVP